MAALKKKKAQSSRTSGGPEQTMRSILDASRAEFAKHGFAGTRIEAIAIRAKVNKQALYYHFGSKDKLYGKVLEDGYGAIYKFISENVAKAGIDEVSPSTAVQTFIESFFDSVVKFPEILDIITDENKYKGKHVKGGGVVRITNPFITYLRTAIERGAASGEFRKDLDPDEVWISTVAVCRFWWNHRYTLTHNLGKDVTSPDLVRERRKHAVKFVLSALRGSS